MMASTTGPSMGSVAARLSVVVFLSCRRKTDTQEKTSSRQLKETLRPSGSRSAIHILKTARSGPRVIEESVSGVYLSSSVPKKLVPCSSLCGRRRRGRERHEANFIASAVPVDDKQAVGFPEKRRRSNQEFVLSIFQLLRIKTSIRA
jgi:hypothetical protein